MSGLVHDMAYIRLPTVEVVGGENKFYARDQIGKTKRSGSGGTGSLKFFKTLLNL